jgi:carbonic anhydrase/acetyltransferase-like protein (isoleucine patch superfamily)
LRNIVSYKEKTPKYHESTYIDESARIIGGVVIGENSGIWPGAILRGDDSEIFIDKNVNIMDKAFLEAPKDNPVIVREGSLISHGVILHGCKIGKHVLVGIGSIILDGAEIGDFCVIAAGSVVPANKKIPPKSMVVGAPCKIVREVTREEMDKIQQENANVSIKAKTYHAHMLDVLEKEQALMAKESETETIFEPSPTAIEKEPELLPEKIENKLARKKNVKFQEIRFDINNE